MSKGGGLKLNFLKEPNVGLNKSLIFIWNIFTLMFTNGKDIGDMATMNFQPICLKGLKWHPWEIMDWS